MYLKIIPTEELDEKCASDPRKKTNKKSFNPSRKIEQEDGDAGLRSMCLRLVHFINRGSRYTYEQVDEIIIGLHQSILKLQKKKQNILKNKGHRQNGTGKKKR